MPSKYPARNLTRDQIDEALVLLAHRGGNCQRTAMELEERGTPVSRETLRQWKTAVHADRYLELAGAIDQASKDAAITTGYREIVHQGQDIAHKALERLNDEIDSIEAKEIAKTVQQLSVTMGIATEKTLLLEGRPTAITESRNPDWYETRMKELGLIDGEAVEITDAEVMGLSDSVGGGS